MFVQTWLRDTQGDMAEKATVMFAIIVAAVFAFKLLGATIAGVVSSVAGSM